MLRHFSIFVHAFRMITFLKLNLWGHQDFFLQFFATTKTTYFLFVSSYWPTRDHIGSSTRKFNIVKTSSVGPVPRVGQTTGSMHHQSTLPQSILVPFRLYNLHDLLIYVFLGILLITTNQPRYQNSIRSYKKTTTHITQGQKGQIIAEHSHKRSTHFFPYYHIDDKILKKNH